MARLVRTQTEMEGRFEDVWTLVDEEDDLETWPADAALDLVGAPATRQTGARRLAGRARRSRGPGAAEGPVIDLWKR